MLSLQRWISADDSSGLLTTRQTSALRVGLRMKNVLERGIGGSKSGEDCMFCTHACSSDCDFNIFSSLLILNALMHFLVHQLRSMLLHMVIRSGGGAMRKRPLYIPHCVSCAPTSDIRCRTCDPTELQFSNMPQAILQTCVYGEATCRRW